MYTMKAIVETTSRQFREHQKDFFDMADNGQKIVIKRGSKQAYVLTSVSTDDLYFTSEMIARIKESQQEIRDGKSIVVKTKEELNTTKDKFGSTYEISKKFIKKLSEVGIIEDLIEYGQMKSQLDLKKNDGKKKGKRKKPSQEVQLQTKSQQAREKGYRKVINRYIPLYFYIRH